MNLLIDIYSVHKALSFGQFKFQNYTKKDFLRDIGEAVQKAFRTVNFSPIIEARNGIFNLSFHPSYIINDDMFEVMACHFAVSSLVNQMDRNLVKVNELTIRSVVVPEAVTSIYDMNIEHQSSIKQLEVYLKFISPSKPHVCLQFESNINDVDAMTQTLWKITSFILEMHSDGDLVFVFDRKSAVKTVTIFECNEYAKLSDLYQNYFIGFDFKVQWNRQDVCLSRECPRRVRCWTAFGNNQRIRFYPESLLWIVPRLFSRSERMTVSEMMKRLYGAEYKWGWRVSLDDPTFDRFYHIITKYEHVTNNYNRNEIIALQQSQSECGLRDNLELVLDQHLSVPLHHFAHQQAFDSDAILEDSLAANRMNDAENSNIFRFLNTAGVGLHFRAFRQSLLRYRGTVCCSENLLSIGQCPYIEDLVTDLQRLKECDLDINVTNFWQFDLESTLSSWSHILSVHKLLSDDDDHEENKPQILNYILQRVQCRAGSKCKALRAQRERRRETTRDERVDLEPDEITAQIEVLSDTLFAIHCRVYHRDNQENRHEPSNGKQNTETRFKMTVPSTTTTVEQEQDDDESEHAEDTVKIPGAINFGRSVLRWLTAGDSPRFDSLKDELIMNPHSTIDLVIYERLRRLSAALRKSTNLTVDETLGLKPYSDTNDFQAALSKAHWDTASDEDRRSFYQWAMTLYRVHLRSALPIPPANASGTKPRPLWTGLNQLLTLSHELGAYYGPLSTTTSETIASRFSKGKGQIYKFVSSYANSFRRTVGIDMKSISCYPQEKEVMIYHSVLPIQSATTEIDDSSELINHLLFSIKSRDTPIVRKEAFLHTLGIKWTSNWIPLILSHKLLFTATKCHGMTVVERLTNELELKFFELILLVRGAMFVDDDYNLKLKKTAKTLPIYFRGLFSEFLFERILKVMHQNVFQAMFIHSSFRAVN